LVDFENIAKNRHGILLQFFTYFQASMEQKQFTNSLFFKIVVVSLFIGLLIFFLISFKDLLKPLALGILFWYLIKAFNGLIGKLKIKGKPLPLWVRRTIALVIILALVEASVEIVVANVKQMMVNYPAYEQTLDIFLIQLGDTLRIENITDWMQKRLEGLNIQGFLQGVLTSASSMLGNIFLLIIYTVFLLLEENSFARKLTLMFNAPGQANKIGLLLDQIYSSTNKYITVKAYVSALTGVLSYVVLIVVGVDFAFLWALLIFALNFIPYIGSIVATALPAIFSILQFGSLLPFVWVFGIIMAIQTIVGNYIEPKVMGKSLNLSPLVVLIALSFWGYVWDLLGMLLSVPITSIMLIIFAQFPATRSIAILLTENGDIESLQIKEESSEKITN
jgi:AI-2 transport protein TqsA